MAPKIEKKLSDKLPGGIENVGLIRDESGNWSYINKLNTNYSDLADMLTELIMRGIKMNKIKGKKVYESIMIDPQKALLKLKKHIPGLINRYFKNGHDLINELEKFTVYSRRFSKIGEDAEYKIANYLIKEGYEIAYQGGNGDFIDMIFGCDLIVKKDNQLKTVQIKHKEPKWSTDYYDVDWIAIANPEIVIIEQNVV